ncbi:hypothetical protein E2562_037183 [Oryza meyeriana var. granulata]|uniref:Uncharacterized protein n=1 Tax=Oryza meyeriana var. granulata TaxID=110450 RepID=A0A6G1DAU8_9ORYZ|nr:hypothetical protein E2562_037183 [Oryza meyeriana var. granulata]
MDQRVFTGSRRRVSVMSSPGISGAAALHLLTLLLLLTPPTLRAFDSAKDVSSGLTTPGKAPGWARPSWLTAQ